MTHLKRYETPKSWNVNKKQEKFIAKPKSTGHKTKFSIPLQVAVRDMLGIVNTKDELKKAINQDAIQIDKKEVKETKQGIGIFDTLTIKKSNENYRITLDEKGRLNIIKIPKEESNKKPCKITGKTTVKGGKTQLALHDGKTIISSKEVKVGDTLILKLPELEIKQKIPMEKGSYAYMTQGKHAGDHGEIKKVEEGNIIYEGQNGKESTTLKEYAIIIGKKEPSIKIQDGS